MSLSRGLKLIGQGSFSRVYKLDEETVLIRSRDPAKECYSMYQMESDRFPILEYMGDDERDKRFSFYKSKFYKRQPLKSSLRPEEYELYKALKTMWHQSFGQQRPDDGYNFWYEEVGKLPDKFATEVEGIRDCLGSLANWGSDICFEISPRNVAVDDGRLILLDCFFFDSYQKPRARKFLR